MRVDDEGRRCAGIIVEVEAYLGVEDKAAHTFGGRRTERVRSMWGDGGHAYVYFIYGMQYCLNLVAGEAGHPVAVLIRALEPTEGLELMYGRRVKAKADTDLCSGPGKLCQALDIKRSLDGQDVVDGELLFVERARRRALAADGIVARPRVGVDYAEEWAVAPLRFYVAGNPHISKR